LGAFALGTNSVDSALLPQVGAGAYTVRVSSPTGKTGVALAELYETGSNGRTSNLSVRVQVQPGDGALIGGFVIQGPAYKRVLIRGIGPTLKVFGVAAALADPLLTIVNSSEAIVATNDTWSAGTATAALVAATASVGAFALVPGTEDAAILITLPPGAYTVKIEGKNGATGVALLEIYEVP
jgi:expansin (peptidoglycan-binding protein)